MNDTQQYLVEEMVEEYQAGRLTRRELLRRVSLISSSAALAATLLSGLAPARAAAAPTRRPASQRDVAVSPNDPDIEAGMVDFPGEGATMLGYLARPRGAGPWAGVLVMPDNSSLSEHFKDIARRLAKQGYVGLAVDYLSRQGGTASFASAAEAIAALGAVTSDQRLPDLNAGIDYLRGLSYVRPASIGAMGFCVGGSLTWRLTTVNPNVRAAVPFYGANPPLAAIPNIQAAILAHYGGEDARINAGIPNVERAMLTAGKTFEYVSYPGAPHGFFRDSRAGYRADAARDAWSRTLDWFARYLGG